MFGIYEKHNTDDLVGAESVYVKSAFHSTVPARRLGSYEELGGKTTRSAKPN